MDGKWHTMDGAGVCKHFKVLPSKGLSEADAKEALAVYGPNELSKEEPTPLWKLVLEQFDDLLVKILLGAAIVSFGLALFDTDGDHGGGLSGFIEPIVILIILILNASVGVWQESNAEAALDALKELQSDSARVIRDGELRVVEAKDLVPGDIVEVKVGDKVPADLRVLELKTTTIRIEQSQLTGESTSVAKQIEALGDSAKVIQDKVNMLFATTTVANGACVGVVVSTGMKTEIGKIQLSVQKAAEEQEDTPLQKKLDEFGELLSKVIGVICVVVWLMNYQHFFDPSHGSVLRGCIYYFKIAVALAVAAIPEGLPAVITTCLALGTRKMAQRNAIVRKLPSVETLGCTTVICSDKTGTLTTNEMCCTDMVFLGKSVSDVQTVTVEGHSFNILGAVHGLTRITSDDKGLFDLARSMALCNESKIICSNGKYGRIGEPTEAALRVLVEKLGVPDAKTHNAIFASDRSANPMQCNDFWESQYTKLATLEFSRDRKSMSVLCRDNASKKNVQFVKGAPEGIIDRCNRVRLNNGDVKPMTADAKKRLLDQVSSMSERALRCLAVAVQDECGPLASYDGPKHASHKLLTDPTKFVNFEQNLVFTGLVAMRDPPRPEVAPSIELCRKAGIRVIVITGDNKKTAESICRNIGVFSATEDISQKSFTGEEFMSKTPAERTRLLMHGGGGRCFSRTEPATKQDLVRLLKQAGEIVAMTGDGVNDAPALKQADIGIAMGIAGTEVAKEAAAMVLADDNFASIVAAVEEGRSIYNNMKAFIRYLISSNIGEVASIFLTAMLGIPEGMAPVQLLWVNLVTDGPPATALGFNPPDMDVMSKPPRGKDDSLITPWVFVRYMVIGLYVGIATVGVFVHWFVYYKGAADGHTLVSFEQLSNFGKCVPKATEGIFRNFKVRDFGGMSFTNPCDYFSIGKIKASTMSLSVLVLIEMFNAMNAISEDGSILQLPPWHNPYVIIACTISMVLHCVILYVPWLAGIFNISPLNLDEWKIVFLWSFPVIIIDEFLKLISRFLNERQQEQAANSLEKKFQ